MIHYLFSFKGRINRAKMWLFIPLPLAWFLLFVFAMAHLPAVKAQGDIVRRGLAVLWMAPIIFAFVAVFVKRLHDRDMSGWWFVFFWGLPIVLTVPGTLYLWAGYASEQLPMWVTACQWVAVLVSVWALAEILLLRGTKGDNRFGLDPLRG